MTRKGTTTCSGNKKGLRSVVRHLKIKDLMRKSFDRRSKIQQDEMKEGTTEQNQCYSSIRD